MVKSPAQLHIVVRRIIHEVNIVVWKGLDDTIVLIFYQHKLALICQQNQFYSSNLISL